MYNIAVIGDRDSVYGFAALGLSTFYVSGAQEAQRCFKRLHSGSYAIIYMTEQVAEQLEEELETVQEEILPAVILIPGVSGNTGQGIKNVRKSVERAVGSDIIFSD